ncbi:MAG: methyltransferase domain-containing protein [Rhodospirillaceae bacterium]|nr:MAG: methyltransferase domain-containing protein [Rhodospirillaceae bacterium]
MTPDDFTFVARLLKERSGLILTKDKSYLLENRLMPVVRARMLKNLDELIERLRGGQIDLTETVVDAMLSKDTGFFRDWRPFQHLRDVVLPNLHAARLGKRHIRVLCAGASTGQEVYSLAMQITEAAESFSGWQVQALGVDISREALTAAEQGVYNQFEVQHGLPIRALLRHFNKEQDSWRINEGLRRMVSFRPWNLLDDLYPLGRFDIVLCRNVLAYFDQQTKLAVLQKLSRLLFEDGVLYVGINETVTGVSSSFTPVIPEHGIYAVHRDGHPDSRSLAIAS